MTGMTMIRFEVAGVPAPKGSARAINIPGVGARLVPSTSNKNRDNLKAWDRDVRAAATTARRQHIGTDVDDGAPVFVEQALRVILNFRMLRPGGHWGARGLKPSAPAYPMTKPDIDKLARSTLDSMKGIVYDEDSRIAELLLHKVYAAKPEDAGAGIIVEPVDG